MIITMLGSSSGCSTAQRDSGGAYIQCSKNILLDAGEATNKFFLNKDADELDVVCITHAHVDHFIGLPMLLLHNLAIRGRNKPLKIIAPVSIMPFLDPFITSYHIRPEFEIDIVYYDMYEEILQWDIDDALINAYEIQHSMDECYGYTIYDRAEDKIIFYTGDTMPCDKLIMAADCDLVIAEGTWASDYTGPRYGHSWVKEMIQLMDENGASKLILTHLSQKYHSAAGYRIYSADVMNAFMNCENLKRIYIAFDGLEVRI